MNKRPSRRSIMRSGGGMGRAGPRLTQASFMRAAARIGRARNEVKRTNVSGLRVIGEEIMTDVKMSRPGKGVPRDTGALASTGMVEGPDGQGDVTLAFGGAAAPYALVQHEDQSYHHDLGEARYLVRGVERWQQNGASVARAARELQRALDRVAEG